MSPVLQSRFLTTGPPGKPRIFSYCFLPIFTVLVQLLSLVQFFATSSTVAHQSPLSSTLSQSFLKLMSIELVMLSNHLILCHPSSLLAFNLSQHKGFFSSESALRLRWPQYWSFSFSISPSHEYSGLISFKIERFDFFAVQGTLKSLLQHHTSKAPILLHSAFFMVQLSHLYMTNRKTTSLTICTFVSKSDVFALLLCVKEPQSLLCNSPQ